MPSKPPETQAPPLHAEPVPKRAGRWRPRPGAPSGQPPVRRQGLPLPFPDSSCGAFAGEEATPGAGQLRRFPPPCLCPPTPVPLLPRPCPRFSFLRTKFRGPVPDKPLNPRCPQEAREAPYTAHRGQRMSLSCGPHIISWGQHTLGSN
ncbi:vegetative cell wall protein gp1-like [Sapajus apella]|uniref:Vegetative cell wall protein gp1-like n=1 Tax=Sapajus apella TaxID=9515 RepID=A0A6J3J950_SAPAP|nr:vegetative cell wall protein gp1-like [Sapajus apella]